MTKKDDKSLKDKLRDMAEHVTEVSESVDHISLFIYPQGVRIRAGKMGMTQNHIVTWDELEDAGPRYGIICIDQVIRVLTNRALASASQQRSK